MSEEKEYNFKEYKARVVSRILSQYGDLETAVFHMEARIDDLEVQIEDMHNTDENANTVSTVDNLIESLKWNIASMRWLGGDRHERIYITVIKTLYWLKGEDPPLAMEVPEHYESDERSHAAQISSKSDNQLVKNEYMILTDELRNGVV